MKAHYLLLVTVLLIWSSQSRIGFGIVGPFTKGAFNCLYSTLYYDKYVMIRAFTSSLVLIDVDPNALQTFKNSYDAGWTADPYIELCRGIDPVFQIKKVQIEVLAPLIACGNNRFDSYFYIKVQDCNSSFCNWGYYSPQENCQFLRKAVFAVQCIGGWTPVIYTTANIWNRFFDLACPNFALETGTQVAYAIYNTSGNVVPTQTFADFIPFGGWTYPLVKQVGGNVTIPLLCGSIPWHAFVDEIYYP